MAATEDAGVGFLLHNLRNSVVVNANLFTEIQDDIHALCDELELLRAFLKNCTEDRYIDDDFVPGLTKRIRKLFFRAEDAIESRIATVSKQKLQSSFKSTLYKFSDRKELRNFSYELAALKQKMQSVYQTEMINARTSYEDRFTVTKVTFTKHPVDDDMVGFKDAMEDVIGYLTDGPNDLQTISIVGMLGLGKTTLARKVFKHPTVEYQFFIRAFIKVSQDFKIKEVLFRLVRCFREISTEDMIRMNEDELRKAIKDYLYKTNYLIVLDDVWTLDVWDQLRCCFPRNQKHSRVLITTQNMNVAFYASEGLTEPYRLRFLNHQESRELLHKRVFGKMNPSRLGLEVHETTILDRCDGLPLAILAAAGILKNDRDISIEVESYDLANQVDHAIKLSFNQLPYRLKLSFLYLGVFPDHFEIPARTLYRLWVSEGFMPPDDGNETSEDKAESYLQHLVDRSLVIVEKKKFNGRIKTIRIHDTLGKFCKMQAVQEELFREIKFGDKVGIMSLDDDRRLCINSKVLEYVTNKFERTVKFVRSFLSYAREDCILPPEYISEIPKAFKLLKVLDIRSITLTQFPVELCYTFLLKYIAMSGDLKAIPEKISNLRYLETLIFNTTQGSIEIKADIWEMKKLRHLETNASTSLQKTKEAYTVNVNLQTLSTISPKSCTLEVLKRAPKLKKLGVLGELAPVWNLLFHSILELECLESLKLLNTAMVPPKYLSYDCTFPANLTRLTLQNTMLSWESMSTLAKLKKLEVLKLKENAVIGRYWDTENTGGFSALQVLHIGDTNLISWKATKGHFPQLKQLYLRHCNKLEDIPSDLVNISTLKLIDIYCCKLELAKFAKKLVFTKRQAQKNNDKRTQLKLSIYPAEQ